MHACAAGLHFNDNYAANSAKLAMWLQRERDAHLALLTGDLAYAL
jgi:hypothetical protein